MKKFNLISLLVLSVLTTFEPVFADSLSFESLQNEKMKCLLKKTSVVQGCAQCATDSSSTGDPNSFFSEMTAQFCSSPQKFCEKIRLSPDSRFVSPRCEPGVINNLWDSREFTEKAVRYPETLNDKEFGQKMAKSIGCSEKLDLGLKSGEKGLDEVYGPRLTMQCDLDKMPKGFSCNWNKFNSSPDEFRSLSDSHASTVQKTESSLKLKMNTMKLSSESGTLKCIMEVPLEGVDRFKAIPKSNESISDFQSRLSADERQVLVSEIEKAKESAYRSFSTLGDLLKKEGTEPFKLAVQMAVSDGNAEKVRKQFQQAQLAVQQYLKTLNPPAPVAVLQLIQNTEMVDLEQVLKSSNSSDFMKLEQLCSKGSGVGVGQVNALNLGVGSGKHRIFVCPQMILNAYQMNPNQLATIFMHEISHSITPCALGSAIAGYDVNSPGACRSKMSGSQKNDLRSFFSRTNQVVECMQTSPSYEHFSHLKTDSEFVEKNIISWEAESDASLLFPEFQSGRTSNSGKVKQYSDYLENRKKYYRDEFQEYMKRPAVVSAKPEGRIPWSKLRGSRASCWGRYAQKKNDLLSSCSPPRTLSKRVSDRFELGQKDQSDEAMADFIAANSAQYLGQNSMGNDLNKMSLEDRRSEILTSWAIPACLGTSGYLRDDHPDAEVRIGILSGAPGVRKLLGCSPIEVKEPSAQLPIQKCYHQFDVLKK